MGEKLKPKYKSDFDLLPEGIFIFRTDKADVKKGDDVKDSVKVFKVESVVEGGDLEGQRAFDNFPLVSKKNFGLERMVGFLIKIDALKTHDKEGKPIEDYDSDNFATDKFEENFKTKIPGKLFGGRIKHVKSKTTGNPMANIVEYYTAKEAEEEMKKEVSKGGGKGKKKDEAVEPEGMDFD